MRKEVLLPKGYEMTITPQPWIHVSERLPEQGAQVLVCWESQPAANPLSIAKFWGEKSECGKCLFWFDGYGAMYASHWMPLPSLPVEKQRFQPGESNEPDASALSTKLQKLSKNDNFCAVEGGKETMIDIVERLNRAGDLAIPGEPCAILYDAAGEIESLRLAIRRLAEQDATLSVCDGSVTVTIDATLTDAEREAVEQAIGWIESPSVEDEAMPEDYLPISGTLRNLLERLPAPPAGAN